MRFDVYISNEMSLFNLFGYNVRTPVPIDGLTQEEIDLARKAGWTIEILGVTGDTTPPQPYFITTWNKWICPTEESLDLLQKVKKHDEIFIVDSNLLFISV